LIDIGSSQQHLGIKENMRVFLYREFFKNDFISGVFYTTNKMTIIQLPLVKQMVCLGQFPLQGHPKQGHIYSHKDYSDIFSFCSYKVYEFIVGEFPVLYNV
jgi:hypothetical protein